MNKRIATIIALLLCSALLGHYTGSISPQQKIPPGESSSDHQITPARSLLESIHIATAFLASCDLLISWDFEFILKGEMMARLKALARDWDLYPTLIGSPELFLKAGYGNPKTLEKLRDSRAKLVELHERKSPTETMEIMKKLAGPGPPSAV